MKEVLDILGWLEWLKAFSLTPTLSRWERESGRPSLANRGASRLAEARTNRLPLPAGEGWGEGERPPAIRDAGKKLRCAARRTGKTSEKRHF